MEIEKFVELIREDTSNGVLQKKYFQTQFAEDVRNCLIIPDSYVDDFLQNDCDNIFSENLATTINTFMDMCDKIGAYTNHLFFRIRVCEFDGCDIYMNFNGGFFKFSYDIISKE